MFHEIFHQAQAASIANMKVNDLVNILWKETDQELEALDHKPDVGDIEISRKSIR